MQPLFELFPMVQADLFQKKEVSSKKAAVTKWNQIIFVESIWVTDKGYKISILSFVQGAQELMS